MPFRFLLAAGLAVLFAPLGQAQTDQGTYGPDGYDSIGDRPSDRYWNSDVQLGISGGPFVYLGPDLLVGDVADQRDDIVQTTWGVTGELLVPVAERVRARAMGGVVNLGADSDRYLLDPADNPFLSGPSILAEGALLADLVDRRTSPLVPYGLVGFGALFATDDANDGVSSTALYLPLGLGLEYQISDKLSIFGEASYRFGLNSVGDGRLGARALFSGNPCEVDPDSEECKKFCDDNPTDPLCVDPPDDPCEIDPTAPGCQVDPCEEDPTAPGCQVDPCDEDPTLPGCETDPCDLDPTSDACCAENPDTPGCGDVGGERDESDFRERFNALYFTGGLRLGLGGPAPARFIPPPPPPVAPVPPPVITPVAPAPVCDLVELNSVYFDYGSAAVDGRARALLNENVELLLSNPACCVFIDGFTDTSEFDQFGVSLAGRRAQAVYDYYLGRGVSASKLQIRNRGVASPPCDKEDPGQGCSRNRRVESIPVDCERFVYLLDDPTFGD